MSEAKIKREIISLAIMLDEISDYAVFIDYTPHVKEIGVRVGASKVRWREKIFYETFYWDSENKEGYLRIKEFLNKEIKKATEII